MLEALAKEIAESLGGLFHPMNFSSQLLLVSLFLLEIFQAMPSSGSILCLQNSWHWQRVMLFPTTSPPMALPLSLFDHFFSSGALNSLAFRNFWEKSSLQNCKRLDTGDITYLFTHCNILGSWSVVNVNVTFLQHKGDVFHPDGHWDCDFIRLVPKKCVPFQRLHWIFVFWHLPATCRGFDFKASES